ncbi:uncharacterized protein SCHCODRAFT_02572699 [Schizophyllum commune H4-8]|nr:uncharacterized protein SCHCODRAFT_02572699 [Schizophyllum commune H4-8]KAI5895291.1 hypothetical protein SCHCODRAFT_02572699 [Schizophyllum commune H4-8]
MSLHDRTNVPIIIDLDEIPDGSTEDAAIDIEALHIADQFTHLTSAEKELRRQDLIREHHKRFARRGQADGAMNPGRAPNDAIVISDSDEEDLQAVEMPNPGQGPPPTDDENSDSDIVMLSDSRNTALGHNRLNLKRPASSEPLRGGSIPMPRPPPSVSKASARHAPQKQRPSRSPSTSRQGQPVAGPSRPRNLPTTLYDNRDQQAGSGKKRKRGDSDLTSAQRGAICVADTSDNDDDQPPIPMPQAERARPSTSSRRTAGDPPEQYNISRGPDFNERTDESHFLPAEALRHIVTNPRMPSYETQSFDWDFISIARNRSRKKPPKECFADRFGLDDLRLTEFFHEAPGDINKIIQQGEFAAYCSFVDGGLPDNVEETGISAYNQDRNGSLVFLRRNQFFPRVMPDEHDMLPGHFSFQETNQPKQYTVSDIAFIPVNDHGTSDEGTLPVLISAGFDNEVVCWEPYEEEEEAVPDAATESTPQEMIVEEERVSGDEENGQSHAEPEVQEVQEVQLQQQQEQQGEQGVNSGDEPQESPLSVIEDRRRKRRSKYYEHHTLCSDYEKPPQILSFRPGTSNVLAVGTEHLDIIDLDSAGLIDAYEIAEPRSGHAVSAIVWGKGPSKDYIFASTEPPIPSDDREPPPIGFHKGIEVRTGRRFELITAGTHDSGAGDALAVSDEGELPLVLHSPLLTIPLGDRLAIAARCPTGHILQILDIRNPQKGRRSVERIALPPFDFGAVNWRKGLENDVNDMSYAPGASHLLALARSDNVALIYDLRNTRWPLHTLRHVGDRAPHVKGYFHGVTQLQWVSHKRLGLVTAGADGCVRLWDPSISSEDDPQRNGTIIAEVDADITAFSLGKRGTKEHTLMVGDSRGRVHIYNQAYRGPVADLTAISA